MNKQAQVTVFIIMGIVILFTVSIVLFIKSETSKIWTEKFLLPEEVMPVREYVQNCLEDVSREGINNIGARGGYATYDDIPEEVKRNPRARLNLFPEAGAVIPLWYYREKEYKPTLYEMQHMLADHIEENIDSCIGDFEAFSDKFEIERLSKPVIRRAEEGKVLKYLARNDVIIDMIYRFKITSKADDEETKMSLFNAKIPIRLKKVFELAEQIYNAENEQLFLEEQLINLMSLNEDLIPITHVKFGECSPLVRTIKDLKSKVKGLVIFNFPNTMISGTNTKELRDEDWYAELHQTYDFGIDGAKDIAVEFRYDKDWPMDFLVSPNHGLIIRAEPMKIFNIIPTCVLQYHFVYDIDFPVLISIIDDETRNHESFVFNFAMPVVINHNKGDKVPDPKHMVVDTVIPPSEEFCENYPKVELLIEARNKVTYDDLLGVSLTYRCTAFECSIGNITKLSGLRVQVPRCSQAVITAKKQGYLDEKIFADASENGDVNIDMTPAEKIKFKIVKRHLDNPRTKYRVKEGEVAVVTMTNDEYDHTSIGVYDLLEPDIAEIELLSQWRYDYNIDIILLKDDIITGGYNGNWTLDGRDLVTAKELELYVFEMPEVLTLPQEESENLQYEILTDMAELSKDIPAPEFIPR